MNNAPCMEVKCNVSNCDYNKSQMCHASELKVHVQGDNVVNSSKGTCCATFKSMK